MGGVETPGDVALVAEHPVVAHVVLRPRARVAPIAAMALAIDGHIERRQVGVGGGRQHHAQVVPGLADGAQIHRPCSRRGTSRSRPVTSARNTRRSISSSSYKPLTPTVTGTG